jgi:uncharacterized protein
MDDWTNPFKFATPLEPPEALVGRDQDLRALERLARAGTYTLLEAPRRYGKTSLLKTAAHRWRETDQALAVWVDFSAVLTVEEAARRVHDAYEDTRSHGRLSDLLRELIASIRLRVGPVELGAATQHADVDQATMLHRLLDVPFEVAHRTGHRALVAFDEFQDVLVVPGLDGLLRSHIQHHAEHVTYVFSGSEPSLLAALFADRARPLYGQAKPMQLKPIPPPLLAEAIAGKFDATGRGAGEGGQSVAAIGAGHPQRTMLLAWHLWELTDPGGTATLELAQRALADALTDRRAELEAISQGLSTVEQRVMVAVAHGLAPSGSRAQRATGIRNRSAARQAANTLLERGQLTNQADGGVRLVDPLLASYLRVRHPLSLT